MAAFDIFEIVVTGKGAHAAMPQLGIDPVVIGPQIVTALQTIASRRTAPIDTVVVSVTQFHAGDTWNVIPETAVISGTVRTFRKETQSQLAQDLERIARGIGDRRGPTMPFRS